MNFSVAQDRPFRIDEYTVSATGGDPVYFHELGGQFFDYSVDHYCGYCVLRVGGLSIPGNYAGVGCEAKLVLSSGVVLHIGSDSYSGALVVRDGQSGNLVVRFETGQEYIYPPLDYYPDAELRGYEAWVMMCIDQFLFESGY